jgi:glyoxylate/succinic semialdehyde reductase
MSETVGFIGLGHMGEGMARRLLSHGGRKLIVWNRSAGKSKALETEAAGKVQVAASPADVVRGATIIFVMLSTPDAVKEVYEMEGGILSGMSAGKKLVDCATLAVADMERLSSQVLAKGGRFLEAPVSGSKVPAATGQLIFLCGGDEALYGEVAKDLDAMGKAKFFFGAVGAGTKVKLAVNMVMGTFLATLGEGLALTEASGIEPKLLLDVLDLGVMSCPLFKLKGPKMLASDYAPHFPLKHAEKDVRLAIGLGAQAGLGLPVAEAVDAAMLRAMAAGYADNDFAATYEPQKAYKASWATMAQTAALALSCVSLGVFLGRRR